MSTSDEAQGLPAPETAGAEPQIPPEHYKAVAEVISYVMRLNRAFRG